MHVDPMILSALGLGSTVSAIIAASALIWTTRETKRRDEKKEAYDGFSELMEEIEARAYHDGYGQTVFDFRKEIAVWTNRVYRVGSPEVCRLVQALSSFDQEDYMDRIPIYDKFEEAARKDLRIDRRACESLKRPTWL